MSKKKKQSNLVVEEEPEYLKNHSPSDEEYWENISYRFKELWSTLHKLKLETKEQAIGKKIGNELVDKDVYWHDESRGRKIRSWLQIPYTPERDEELFIENWEIAKQLGESLAPKIESRDLTSQLIFEWGGFSAYASVIESAYFEGRPGLQYLKGAATQSIKSHKIFYARLFVRLREEGDNRGKTDGRVLDYIYNTLEKDEFPDPRFDRSWYERFLSDKGEDFTVSFKPTKDKNTGLSIKDIENLAGESDDDLPKIDV